MKITTQINSSNSKFISKAMIKKILKKILIYLSKILFLTLHFLLFKKIDNEKYFNIRW